MNGIARFSSQVTEQWREISEFPSYSVSTHGRVMNTNTNHPLKIVQNSRGLAMVGLMKNGLQYKRSLPLIVATAFIPPHPWGNKFDTPINLNGDRLDNQVTNLTWRPLWFARRYCVQFTDGHKTIDEPIEDVETGERYDNSMQAATTHGILDSDLCLSILNMTYAWPTGHIFQRVLD